MPEVVHVVHDAWSWMVWMVCLAIQGWDGQDRSGLVCPKWQELGRFTRPHAASDLFMLAAPACCGRWQLSTACHQLQGCGSQNLGASDLQKICLLSSELLILYAYIYTHTQIIKTYIYIYSLYIFFFRVGDPENYGKATHVRWPIGYISPGHVRGRVLAQPHVSLAAGDADPLVRRAAGHRRCGLQRWKGLRHQGMEPKGWSHAEPWWLLVSRASFRVSHGIGGKWLSWSGMPNSWKFSYPAQETASDKVSRSDWCDTVGSVLLEFQADEGKQDETSTGSWKERSCFIESWLLKIESMAWFKGKSSVNPFFEWFVHMCTIRYRVFPFPVSLKPTQWLKAHSPKEWVEGPRSLGKHLGPEHGLCDSFGALLPWAREV